MEPTTTAVTPKPCLWAVWDASRQLWLKQGKDPATGEWPGVFVAADDGEGGTWIGNGCASSARLRDGTRGPHPDLCEQMAPIDPDRPELGSVVHDAGNLYRLTHGLTLSGVVGASKATDAGVVAKPEPRRPLTDARSMAESLATVLGQRLDQAEALTAESNAIADKLRAAVADAGDTGAAQLQVHQAESDAESRIATMQITLGAAETRLAEAEDERTKAEEFAKTWNEQNLAAQADAAEARAETARVRQEADDAIRDAEQKAEQADIDARNKVAKAQEDAEATILAKQTEFEQKAAEADAAVLAAESRATGAEQESQQQIQAAQDAADEKVAKIAKAAEEKIAKARRDAEAAKMAAEQTADQRATAAEKAAAEETTKIRVQAETDKAAAIAAAEQAAEEKITQRVDAAQKRADAEIARAKTDADARVDGIRTEAATAKRDAEERVARAEAAAETARVEAQQRIEREVGKAEAKAEQRIERELGKAEQKAEQRIAKAQDAALAEIEAAKSAAAAAREELERFRAETTEKMTDALQRVAASEARASAAGEEIGRVTTQQEHTIARLTEANDKALTEARGRAEAAERETAELRRQLAVSQTGPEATGPAPAGADNSETSS